MTEDWTYGVILFATLGSAVMSGMFFTFSNFVMRALGRLPPSQGIAAMQSINGSLPTPLFIVAFVGTAVACGSLAALAWPRLDEGGETRLVFAASVLYLVGCFALTIVYHVPRNRAIDRLDPNARTSEARWTRYATRWTAWNHVRTAAALAATTSFVLALG